MSVLVTGGAGYIGSHTLISLINAGFDPIVVDNLSNSKITSIKRVEKIVGKEIKFYENDVCDEEALEKIFSENDIDSAIHFAGLKAVGESVQKPIEYYDNNILSTLSLCKVMRRHGVKKIVFSSSATVYGEGNTVPLTEDMPTGATNPYGRTKLFIEHILRDLFISDNDWSIALLRYFNPIGAHESGTIGEDPKGIPNNLMPYISQVAVGKLQKLHVFGNDYDTPDGTGVRDYIHVVDLAKGHAKALKWVHENKGCEAINLGTGKGTSVLELKNAFEKASNTPVPFVIDPRRPGDLGEVYANAGKAEKLLGWKAEFDVNRMCEDSWRWQKNNPNGYDD